jgi:hypothetical protein
MNKNLNGFSISEQLFAWIGENIPIGSVILELGSGSGTIELCKYYTVYSVEHDEKFIGLSRSNYIHAPIKSGWYDVEILKKQLPEKYDLLLIDGPPGTIGRHKFFENIHLFRTNIPVIFDDTHRKAEKETAMKTAAFLGRPYQQFSSNKKSFIVC